MSNLIKKKASCQSENNMQNINVLIKQRIHILVDFIVITYFIYVDLKKLFTIALWTCQAVNQDLFAFCTWLEVGHVPYGLLHVHYEQDVDISLGASIMKYIAVMILAHLSGLYRKFPPGGKRKNTHY